MFWLIYVMVNIKTVIL